MTKIITINEDVFNEMIRKKEEFDAIVESIELMNNPNVKESIRKSKEDIGIGRVHKLRDILYNLKLTRNKI
ncbi:hypothetical protein HYW99_03050 [Candidatus Woesearchaeota archaeon]|nr:hypothetical protein [Candidatus Woesearchaeota archaeon]